MIYFILGWLSLGLLALTVLLKTEEESIDAITVMDLLIFLLAIVLGPVALLSSIYSWLSENNILEKKIWIRKTLDK